MNTTIVNVQTSLEVSFLKVENCDPNEQWKGSVALPRIIGCTFKATIQDFGLKSLFDIAGLGNQRVERDSLGELVATLQTVQLDHNVNLGDDSSDLSDEGAGSGGSSSSGHEIVDDDDTGSSLKGLLLDLHFGGSVLKSIRDLLAVTRELSSLADSDERKSKSVSEGNSEIVSTRVQSDDGIQLGICTGP